MIFYVLSRLFHSFQSSKIQWVERKQKLFRGNQGLSQVVQVRFEPALIQLWETIRIFHGCEVQIEKSIRGSLFVITRLCWVMPNSDLEGWIFLSSQNNPDRFFFLHTFWPAAFDLTSAILKFDVICDIAMTSTPSVLMAELRDLLYNQCIDNTCCYSFFIYRTGRIRVGKIRFVRTGKPCLVCKNNWLQISQWNRQQCCR